VNMTHEELHDGILAMMKEYSLDPTSWESYVNFTRENPPEELSAEEIAELPACFQLPDHEQIN
jgi:hypothetical protein